MCTAGKKLSVILSARCFKKNGIKPVSNYPVKFSIRYYAISPSSGVAAITMVSETKKHITIALHLVMNKKIV